MTCNFFKREECGRTEFISDARRTPLFAFLIDTLYSGKMSFHLLKNQDTFGPSPILLY